MLPEWIKNHITTHLQFSHSKFFLLKYLRSLLECKGYYNLFSILVFISDCCSALMVVSKIYHSLYLYKACYFMHGCKPHKKTLTMHYFSLVRNSPGNLLGTSAATAGLISTCTSVFCEVSASPAGGSKIHQASHPKPKGDNEQHVVNSAGESSRRED